MTNQNQKRNSRLDVESIKNAANNRWLDILTTVGSIPREILNGRHHPCPKCGGKDRFRLLDANSGAVFCNQCLSSRNGDGIAAVMWMRGLSFTDALREIANHLGVDVGES